MTEDQARLPRWRRFVNSVYAYLRRLVEKWLAMLLLLLDLVGAVLFYRLAPEALVSESLWAFWVVAVILFLAATYLVYTDQAAEKQLLQDRLNAYEDIRANIRFNKTEDFCYSAPSQGSCPFPALEEVKRGYQTGLDGEGVPVWIVIGALLEGENKSTEPGRLRYEIIKVDVPRIFTAGEGNQGEFQWLNGCPLVGVPDWKDLFRARYEFPVRLAEYGDSRSFAQALKSLGSYRVIVQYWTLRGIDNESERHALALEGDFTDLRDELCEKWRNWGYKELADIAACK